MQAWITTNGGLIATVVGIATALNVVLSAIQTICNQFKVKEPSGLQTVASAASSVVSFLSANVPTKDAPAPASPSGMSNH